MPLYTQERDLVAILREGEPQGRFGRVRKICPPPEFDLRTVRPVASRCMTVYLLKQDVQVRSIIGVMGSTAVVMSDTLNALKHHVTHRT